MLLLFSDSTVVLRKRCGLSKLHSTRPAIRITFNSVSRTSLLAWLRAMIRRSDFGGQFEGVEVAFSDRCCCEFHRTDL
jgi:hypothetical protein